MNPFSPRLVWGKAFKTPSLPHAPIPAKHNKKVAHVNRFPS